MREGAEGTEIRTRISRGYQVVVPSRLRKQYKLDVGDEVVWVVTTKGIAAKFRKGRSLSNVAGLGRSGSKNSSVVLKKRVQKGEI